MITSELIRLLQEIDPKGDTPVCVDNVDIFFVDAKPAYWDGRLQELVRDKGKSPYYNVVGAKYHCSGEKICIETHSVKDAILENPDLPVDFSELERCMPASAEDYKRAVDGWREESRRVRS